MSAEYTLREWTATDLRISAASARFLHERFGAQFDISPSWSTSGMFNVTPKGVIGSVAIPDGHLLIEPKVDLDVALRMLEEVLLAGGAAPELLGDEAPVAHTTVTAAVAAWFVRLALPLAERFLTRSYRERADDLFTVRGRVDVVASTRAAIRQAPPRLTCRFDEFTSDIVINQVLKAAATALAGNPSLAPSTLRGLRRLQVILAEVSLRVPARWERQAIVFDRRTERYRPALKVGEWILDRTSPELGGPRGSRRFETFLVSMHGVFEEYVARKLARLVLPSGLSTTAKDRRPIDVERRLFHTEPDILVGRPGRLTVLDTKYKAFDEDVRPSEADVYQVLSYCVTRGSKRAILVYPARSGSPSPTSFLIAGADVTIDAFPLSLGQGRAGVARSIAALADHVVAVT